MEDLIYISRLEYEEYERLQRLHKRNETASAFVFGVAVGVLLCVVTARIVGG